MEPRLVGTECQKLVNVGGAVGKGEHGGGSIILGDLRSHGRAPSMSKVGSPIFEGGSDKTPVSKWA